MKTTTQIEETAVSQVPIGAIFRHYGGREYKILQVGRHSEDMKLCVVYQGLYHCDSFGSYPIWIRPLEMFLETVVIEGIEQSRFTLTHQPSPVHE